MRSRFALLLAPLLASSVTACGPLTGVACTEEARTSVTIQAVDADGAAVPDAVVTYTIDGGAQRSAECSPGPSGAGCDQWSAGLEESGLFVITATDPAGPAGTATVVVGEDECHVISESVTVTVQ